MIFKRKEITEDENPRQESDTPIEEDGETAERERLKAEIIAEVSKILGAGGDVTRERLEFDAERMLAQRNLPTEFARMLTGETAEETKENIGAFGRLFAEKTAEAVKEKIKGSVPKIGSIKEKDSFLEGLE